jgi:hypothetical protein
MYSSDKGLTTDKARTSLPRSSPLRRRLTSRLQPLHGGLGFGAGAIRERAMVVARQASQRGAVQPSRPNMGSSGHGLQFTEEKTVVRELEQIPFLLDEDTSSNNDARMQALNNQVRRAAVQQSTPQRSSAGIQVPESAPVPSIKSFIVGSRRNAAPSFFQGLTAWFFDALVIAACLVLAFTLSASVPFVTLLAQKFPALSQYGAFDGVHSSPLGWLLLMAQTFALGSMFLFAVQAFSGFFLAASVGRAIADVRLANYRSPLGRAFKIGMGEMLQWPLAFGLLNAIVSPEHNFLVRSLKWARGTPQN